MVIKQRVPGLLGQLQLPFLEGNNQGSDHISHGAALRRHHDINPRPHEEKRARKEHQEGRDGQPDGPTHARLHVHDHRQRHHHREGEGEVVPVEEAVHAPFTRLCIRVELIRPERQITRPNPTRPDHEEHECAQQECHLSR